MSDNTMPARYTVVPFEAEIAEGGGTKYMVIDAEKGGLGGGGVVYRDGGHLFTRNQDRAEQWAAELNAPVAGRERARDHRVQAVTEDPRFLGDPPVRKADGLSGVDFCSFCPRPWFGHQLDGVAVSGRVAHRFDLSPAGGFYSDELEAFQS